MEFTLNQWLVVGLVLLFGLLIGAALATGGGRKHKVRYQEETRRATELEAENVRLRKELKDAEVDAVPARARTPGDRV